MALAVPRDEGLYNYDEIPRFARNDHGGVMLASAVSWG